MKTFSICSLALIAGCMPYLDPAEITEFDNYFVPEPLERNVRIVGVYDFEKEIIIKFLNMVNRPVRNSIRVIEVRDGELHFNPTIIAHRCTKVPRKVCIKRGKLSSRVICHEAAHVYVDYGIHDSTNTYGSQFVDMWKVVAGNVYVADSKKFKSNKNFKAKNGLLTDYSRKSPDEDIAEWVMECAREVHFKYLKSALDTNKHLKTDPRYRQKLELLYKYKFLSESHYNKLKPLFE